MISKDSTFSRIEQSGNLPTLPAILIKLLAACDDDDTPMAEIAAIISKDPVISCKVLQLVNSAYYSFRYAFTNIEKAVIHLGANTIRNLAVTMSVHQVFRLKSLASQKKFNINIFWYHSLLCATLARRLAQKTDYGNIDEAYLAGLLHDIGRLILVATFPTEHETILAKTKDRQNTLWAEQQLLGVTHSETGGWLLEKWRLDSMLADAVRYHHEPPDRIIEAFPLVKIIYTANLLCHKEDINEQHYTDIELLTGLDHDAVEEIVGGAEEEVEDIALNLEIKIKKPDQSGKGIASQGTPSPASGSEADTAAHAEVTLAADTVDEQEQLLEQALTARVKSVSLLSSFLENLAHAGNAQEIVAAGEQAMGVLFGIEKVLFFLPDNKDLLLIGKTSPVNTLYQPSRGLTLTLQKSSSVIVQTFHQMLDTWLKVDCPAENLADRQILKILNIDSVLLVPLIADKKPAGVILLGLADEGKSLNKADHRLLRLVIHQVALCLQMERMKEQKAAELEAARIAAVSMTARKVAHEINNPLGIISNYITSMLLKNPADEVMHGELTVIDEEIQRISSLIRQLDVFSKDPGFHFEETDVNAIIEGIIRLFNAAQLQGPRITLSFIPAKTLPTILTAKDAIKQILINLCKNGAEAMADGGTITVQTRQAAPEAAAGQQGIEILVADTGPGLPAAVRTNIYTPFVTTKQNGHSGLGLSIVYKTVMDLGGKISYTSDAMNGTCFSIFLPNIAQKDPPGRVL